MNYYLTSDFLFKAMFGRDTERSKQLLIDLLNGILKRKAEERIVEVYLKDPYSIRESVFEKETIFDIKVKLETGEFVDIEMQIAADAVYRKRSLFYWSKLYGSQEIKGQNYSKLCKCICINIVDSSCIYESNELHHIFKCIERSGHYPLSDDLEIHYFQLDKLDDIMKKEADEMEIWLSFIKNIGHPDKQEIIEKIVESKEVMKLANEEYKHLTSDDVLRERYEAHEKYLMDRATLISMAETRGLEQGREQGKREIAKLIAKKMVSSGMELEVISRMTGLMLNEIKKMIEGSEVE